MSSILEKEIERLAASNQELKRKVDSLKIENGVRLTFSPEAFKALVRGMWDTLCLEWPGAVLKVDKEFDRYWAKLSKQLGIREDTDGEQ